MSNDVDRSVYTKSGYSSMVIDEHGGRDREGEGPRVDLYARIR